MKALGLQTLKVSDIDFGERLRQISEDHAQLLAQNMREVGRLRQPIEVRTRRAKAKGLPFLLIAGGHRLRGAQINEWAEIEAFVFEMKDEEARLAEIDENLVRHDLNPLDRAVFLAERKTLYLKLHPETAAGVAGAEAKHGRANDIMSFAAATAEKCGWSIKTIERAVAIANGLQVDVRRRIAGTWLAYKQSELMALIKLSPSEQMRALDMILCEPPQVRSVEAAKRFIQDVRETGVSATETAFQKLLSAWVKADKAAQRQFLRHLRETGALAEPPVGEKEVA